MTTASDPIEPVVPFVGLAGQDRPPRVPALPVLQRVLAGDAGTPSKEVERFEAEFAACCGTRYAIAVSSGAAALSWTLRALGIGPGDEVIAAPNSPQLTVAAIVQAGATPVFCDVRCDLNLDPDRIDAAVTRRTRAILPVHRMGRPAALDRILEVAGRRALAVVEDATQAVGARYREAPVGSIGHAGGFSLSPDPTLGAYGEAGVVTTQDPVICEELRKLRNRGFSPTEACGENAHLDAAQAGLLRLGLAQLELRITRRRQIAAFYHANLPGSVERPLERPYEHCVYPAYTIQVEERDALHEHLLGMGIASRVPPPIPAHLLPAAASLGYATGEFPVAERLAQRVLNLPIHPELAEAQLERVADAVRSFLH